MNDTAEVKLAADKLDEALGVLEGALGPMLSEMKSLRKIAAEAEHFEADRTSLAQQLDEAKAQAETLQTAEQGFKDRENRYQQLASDHIAELDSIIAQVRTALGQEA